MEYVKLGNTGLEVSLILISIHIHQILKNRLILHGRMNLIFNHFQNKKW